MTNDRPNETQELGCYLKAARALSGLKQNDVAGQLGITACYLSLIENGRRVPSLCLLKRLNAHYGGAVKRLIGHDIHVWVRGFLCTSRHGLW